MPFCCLGVTQLNCGSTRPSVSDYGDRITQTRQLREGRIRLQRVFSSLHAQSNGRCRQKYPHENLLCLFNLQIF